VGQDKGSQPSEKETLASPSRDRRRGKRKRKDDRADGEKQQPWTHRPRTLLAQPPHLLGPDRRRGDDKPFGSLILGEGLDFLYKLVIALNSKREAGQKVIRTLVSFWDQGISERIKGGKHAEESQPTIEHDDEIDSWRTSRSCNPGSRSYSSNRSRAWKTKRNPKQAIRERTSPAIEAGWNNSDPARKGNFKALERLSSTKFYRSTINPS
jgi:hypothetical protein